MTHIYLLQLAAGMRHRRIGSSLAALVLVATLAACSANPGGGDYVRRPPHILIILADDLGWNDVGYHGSDIKTPTIDSLARAGVRFEQFYSFQVCTPTRYALLTGRYPIRNGFHVGVIKPWATWGLPQQEWTLAEVLNSKGYATAIVGKWHLGHHDPSVLPFEHGFAHQYGPYNGMIDYFSHKRLRAKDWHRNQQSLQENGYATDLFAQEAVRLIQNHDVSRPLFLYLPFTAPHTPLQAPPHDVEMYDHLEAPERRTYAAMVTNLDDAIADIVEALKKKEMFSETLLVFLSDNGGSVDRGASNFPLRGEKGTFYQGGIRVPALMVWPNHLAAGGVVKTPAHIVDLFPTLAGLAGPLPSKYLDRLDGVQLWDIVHQQTGAEDQQAGTERELLLGFNTQHGAILRGKWKAVVTYQNGKPSQTELFDLDDDPREQHDLSALHPQLAAQLRARLSEYAAQATPPRITPKPEGWNPPDQW